MLQIHCLASSSSGNCYLLNDGINYLIVEAGLDWQKMRKMMTAESIDLMRVSGCLITHAHQDHCKGAKELSRYIPLYASQFTLDAIKGYKMNVLKEFNINKIDTFEVIPFTVEHDIAGAYGFIIKLKDHTILFVNDTKMLQWDLKSFKFTEVMIECNYVDEMMKQDNPKNFRTINSHMALSTTIATLKALDLSECKAIYLMHLSDGNSNERLMIDTVKKETGIKTYTCNKWGGFYE